MADLGLCFTTFQIISNKQQLASVSSKHRASGPDLQVGFFWRSPSPAQVASISDCFITQAGWPWAKYRWGLTLACTTGETPGPAHPIDSYRPRWNGTPRPCPCTADSTRVEVGLGCTWRMHLGYSAWKGGRGGCATGPYRTPTALGHTTKTQNQSSST